MKFFLWTALVIVFAVGAWFGGNRFFAAKPSVPTGGTQQSGDTSATASPNETADPASGGTPLTLPFGPDAEKSPSSDTPVGLPLVSSEKEKSTEPVVFETAKITIKGIPITVEIADTRVKQEKGLTARQAPARGNGMLYVLARPSRYSYTPEGMLFNTDLIWIGEDAIVSDVTQNVSPQSVPETFEPKVPIRYLLEMPAGFIQRNGIKEEDAVDVSAIK